jgi:F-type H+-transporting ATPase subunit delta
MATDSITTVARPYAKAAFELALEEKSLKAWSAMLYLMANIALNEEVKALVESPGKSAKAVSDFFIDVCGKHINQAGQHFLKVLSENNRLLVLPEICSIFEFLKAEQEKTLEVDVLSFEKLDKQQEKAMHDALKKKLSRDIQLNIKIDKSLLGGAVIQAGSLVIDGSVRTKLDNLNLGLQEA